MFVDELVAPDIFNHPAVPEHQHGIAGFKHVVEWVRTFSSDVHYHIDDIIYPLRITLRSTKTIRALYRPKKKERSSGFPRRRATALSPPTVRAKTSSFTTPQ